MISARAESHRVRRRERPGVTTSPATDARRVLQLILTAANQYLGPTTINAGWVTVQNNQALGAHVPGLGDTVQPYTTVKPGAALHLKPLTAMKQAITEPLKKEIVPWVFRSASSVFNKIVSEQKSGLPPDKLKTALDSETAKKVAAAIKDAKLKKVQAAIQGDQVRISSPSKDDLQGAIQLLRSKDFGVELKFGNYR